MRQRLVPSVANGWNYGYHPASVAPVRALVVDGYQSMDTSLDAGQVFTEQLAADGVTVDGDVTRRTAERTEVSVARHLSPKLSCVIHTMLRTVDRMGVSRR
ncbi:D-alanyl-D-alanine carboxypeptidase [Streptomyces canus]|uniref:D-alanyl-D-alanine carboxypeptidase n=1 Tax=Streptomyces canus TaxID=58343 RepID=UPI0003717760|nr:D-alanyl-D-alanine carboxypeptidase [Streptomyces canus]